jgi:membrane fusion protein YbhG
MTAKLLRLSIIVVALGGWAAYTWLDRNNSEQQAGGAILYGNVDIREVDLGFRIGGRLASMRAEEGDPIAKGQLLAVLDDAPQREALALAQAGVAEAQANLQRLQAGSRPQEIHQAKAGVAEARATLTNTEQELKRQRELVADNLSSQQQLDVALTRRQRATARLAVATETLALAIEGPRQEDIATAQASLAAANARKAQATTQLQDTVLQSPSEGVILSRIREPGSILNPGAAVYTLSLKNRTYVRAYVSEPNLGAAVPGMTVTFTTDGNDRVYSGQIGFVSPRAEFTPKTVETQDLRTDLVYRLRIVVEDADTQLRQGMPVTISLNGG